MPHKPFFVKRATLADELERRKGQTGKLVRFVLAHPHVWIGMREFDTAIGPAWRSRLVEAREILALDNLELPWNGVNGAGSCYMLRPKALGRDASEVVDGQRNLPGFGISSVG